MLSSLVPGASKPHTALYYKLFYKKPFVVYLVILSLVVTPLFVQASLFSVLVGDTAHAEVGDTTVPPQNSQMLRVLEPHIGLDPLHDEDYKTNLQVDDGALVSAVGPLGTLADVAELPASTQISTYIVHPGDTIGEIAEMFGVSKGTIRFANDLGSNETLKVGTMLVILPTSGVKHTVGKNDTLASIAKKYGADMDDIVRFNDVGLNSTLSAGDTILVPNVENEVLATIDAKEAKAKISKGGANTGGKSYNSKSAAGYYIWPIEGGRGRRSQGAHGYQKNSVDLAAPAGTNIVAAAAGRVIVSKNSGWNGGYGNYVIIQHQNGTTTTYAHLSRATVAVGTQVAQGQVIGVIGRTGNSTGVHVHFEVRGGNIENPGIKNTWK